MVATWRSIVMPVMGSSKLPVASAKRQVRALEEHGKLLGEGKMAEIAIIAPDAPLPEADSRAVLDGGVPIVSPYYGSVAALFEGTGFRAALVRGILTSFQVMSRKKFPQKVFSSIDECAKWTFANATALGMVVESPQDIADAMKFVKVAALSKKVFSTDGAAPSAHA
jgi:hypothetical protein